MFEAEALYQTLLNKLKGMEHLSQTHLVGVYSGGVWLAERLHKDLALATPLAMLSSMLHRDDLTIHGLHPSGNRTSIPYALDGKKLLLIDDVLYTGRTIRAALNELFDFGRPASVKLATLVVRSGRELPIAADYFAQFVELDASARIYLSQNSETQHFELAVVNQA